MYNTSGVQSYQQIGVESAVMNASPHQLIVMLFDGAHSALVRARLFMEAGQIREKGEALRNAAAALRCGGGAVRRDVRLRHVKV